MRQNDIFKKFNLPRWATPIICGLLLLGSAGDFAMKFFEGEPAQQWPYYDYCWSQQQEGSRGIPSHKSNGGSLGSTTKARPYRCSSKTSDTLYWDRHDNSGSRQTAAEGGSLPVLVHTLWRLYAIYVYTVYMTYTSNRICIVLQKNVYFWYML